MSKICRHRFEMTKALATAYASRVVRGADLKRDAWRIVDQANELVNILERIEDGEMPKQSIEDVWEDVK